MSKTMILFFVSFLVRLHILTPIRVARLKFFYKLHRWPDFRHPRDINEKINWMKFYGDTSQWPLLADKYRVRGYIEERIGAEYLIPLIGKWDTVEEIDWDSLPQQFVMKANNGSGDVVVCKDKRLLDKERTMKHFHSILQNTYGVSAGEPHYSFITPCIIAEQLLDSSKQPNGSSSLIDYKIWSFNGQPAYIVCYSNRHDAYYSEIGVYDTEWRCHPEYLKFSKHYKKERRPIPRPSCLNEMLQIAAELSKGHPQVRVDLYMVDGHVYFGELTFSSSGGYMNHFTQLFLDKLGELTVLPIDKKNENVL